MNRRRRTILGRRGVASIEFAIAIPVVLVLMGWLYDISNLLIARVQLSNAVANAGGYALLAGTTVSGATLTGIVQTSGMLAGATATVSGPACYCVAYTPTHLTSATCGVTCSNGVTAGTYVTVNGSYTYVPLLPGLSSMTSTVVTESVSVKLQ
jgi:Flp pilus assembly protein TadG